MLSGKNTYQRGRDRAGEVRKGSLHMSAVVNLEGFQAADDRMIWVVLIMDGRGQANKQGHHFENYYSGPGERCWLG